MMSDYHARFHTEVYQSLVFFSQVHPELGRRRNILWLMKPKEGL
jgi:hypothetical protein